MPVRDVSPEYGGACSATVERAALRADSDGAGLSVMQLEDGGARVSTGPAAATPRPFNFHPGALSAPGAPPTALSTPAPSPHDSSTENRKNP